MGTVILGSMSFLKQEVHMVSLALIPMFGAIGYSILYLLFGGGLFGAVVIFFIARAFGR
jgi:hypothetical protein